MRQFYTMANQASPHRAAWIVEAFKKATSNPFSYILCDYHPLTPEILRYRARIFPCDQSISKPYVVFVEKSKKTTVF